MTRLRRVLRYGHTETRLRVVGAALTRPDIIGLPPPAAPTAATTMHTGARDLRGLMVSADLNPRVEESDKGDLGLDGLERATADTWRHWTHMRRARLSEAVALLCGLEPTSLPPQGVWKLAPILFR